MFYKKFEWIGIWTSHKISKQVHSGYEKDIDCLEESEMKKVECEKSFVLLLKFT